MRVRAIVNLRAGIAAHRALDVFAAGRPGWPRVEVRLTEGPGHATELARQALLEGASLVLAAGGDGTVNEAAQGLEGSAVPLGILPVGSGNGLARALRIPLRPDRALCALETGVARPIDVGQINGKPFLNVAGVGFDALVGGAFHAAGSQGGRRGIWPYVRTSVALLSSYEPSSVRVETEDAQIETRPFLVSFANGPQYGGGAVLNPGARLDDGRFEVIVFEDGSLLGILAAAPRLFLGGIERSPGYRRLRTMRAVLEVAAPLVHHRDGEPEPKAERYVVTLKPRALNVIVPRTTATDPAGPFAPG